MKYLFIQNKAFPDRDFTQVLKYEKFEIINLDPGSNESALLANDKQDENDSSQTSHKNPWFFDAVEEIGKKEFNYDGIIISHWLYYPAGGDNDQKLNHHLNSLYSAYQLATHIRLSRNEAVRTSPILIITPNDLTKERILQDFKGVPHILLADYGTELVCLEKLDFGLAPQLENEQEDNPFSDKPSDSSESKPKKRSIEQKFTKARQRQEIQKDYNSEIGEKLKLYIRDEANDRHGVANYFGAYRMALNRGVDFAEKYPKTLYFQYLLTLSPPEGRSPNLLSQQHKKLISGWKDKRVLLVDDQIDQGWEYVLKSIFPKLDPKSSWTTDKEKEIKDGDYDLILLDYRLGNGSVSGQDGLHFLEKIKGRVSQGTQGEPVILEKDKGLNPTIPVIIFTASNKAWNMDKLYEAGADGYYIKEHPDTASDPDFSKGNFNGFLETVDRCLKKGALLKPYWAGLQKIWKSFNGENPIVPQKELEGGVRFNRDRITERLTMFIGLLKKASDQTRFDEGAFFYSEYELAFLTLWSVLNDLQEALYIKDQPDTEITDRSGSKQTRHIEHRYQPPIRYFNFPTTKHFKWLFKSQTFLSYHYEVDPKKSEVNPKGFYNLLGEERSNFIQNQLTKVYSSLEASKKTDVPYAITLHMQIAFLIEVLCPGSALLVKLPRLNDIRNKLYLTHGGEPNSNQFSRLYSSGRISPEDWQKNISELFEIVYFLCTAEEWKE